MPPGEAWLSVAECDHLRTLVVPKRREDYRLGRWASRVALATLAEAPILSASDAARYEIRPRASGAPEAYREGVPLSLSFSLSHSASRAFVVLGPTGVALGCDLEVITPRSAGFLDDYLCDAERRSMAASPAAERPLLATLLWAAKEAVLKAVEEGLRLPPAAVVVDCLTLPLSPNESWQAFSAVVDARPRRWGGWWRCDGDQILTVASSPPLPPPELLERARLPRLLPGGFPESN